jgi:hypothetical protein
MCLGTFSSLFDALAALTSFLCSLRCSLVMLRPHHTSFFSFYSSSEFSSSPESFLSSSLLSAMTSGLTSFNLSDSALGASIGKSALAFCSKGLAFYWLARSSMESSESLSSSSSSSSSLPEPFCSSSISSIPSPPGLSPRLPYSIIFCK